MSARRIAVAVSIAAVALLPSAALAHDGDSHRGGGLSAARRVARSRRLESFTSQATAADAGTAAAAVTGAEGDVG